ncbi:MAG: hypothetical protein J6T14_03535, partial [Clostridia bacterium]|nr:hypothetical protein [Clostridia bacterium]
CVLRKNDDGEYEECDYYEKGIIVANSATTMARYKNDWEKTKDLVITDKYGIDWVSSTSSAISTRPVPST